MEVLRVENLCKVYGKGETRVEALKNVSFSMEKVNLQQWSGNPAPAKARCYTVSAGWSNLPPDTSTWMAGICLHCEKTSARSSGGKTSGLFFNPSSWWRN